MTVNFSSIYIHNFMSIKRFSHHFKEGVTVLSGPNGVGKSSILEAMLWCLYGVTRSKALDVVSSWSIGTPRETSVEIFFFHNHDQYRIVRTCLGSPVVEVWRNRTEITQADSSKFFETLIPKEAFFSYCYNEKNSFLQLSNIEKRKILNSLYGFDQVEPLLKFVTNEAKATKRLLNEVTLELSELKGAVKQVGVNLANLELNKRKWEAERKGAKSLEDLPTWEALESLAVDAYKLVNSLERDRIDLGKLMTGPCPTCGAQPPKQKRDIKSLLSEIESKLEEAKECRREVHDLRTEYLDLKALHSEDTWTAQIEEQEHQKERLQAEIDSQSLALEQLNHELKKIEYFVEAFKPKGLPSLLLKKTLELLSSVANNFSGSTRQNIHLLPERGDVQKISCTVNGKFYEGLSSGEKKRVDLAILYALRVTARHQTNLLILDETFDSLDTLGIDFVFQWLAKLSEENHASILLSTHDQGIKQESVTLIELENVDGETVIKK